MSSSTHEKPPDKEISNVHTYVLLYVKYLMMMSLYIYQVNCILSLYFTASYHAMTETSTLDIETHDVRLMKLKPDPAN